jgi:hypothetical protein
VEENVSSITANSNMHLVLSQVSDVTEIRDRDGNVLGTYTPKGKAAEGTDKRLLLVCFEDGATVLFDMQRVEERLARQKDRARPFRAIITELAERASQRT